MTILANIPWNTMPAHVGVGCLGALALIMLRAYQLRGKMPAERFKLAASSLSTWLIVVGGVLASGLFTWAMFGDSDDPALFKLFITGATAPALLNQAVAAIAANQPPVGGKNPKFNVKELFE